jgi:hypothetical protein
MIPRDSCGIQFTTVFQLAHNTIPRDSCGTQFTDKINALYHPMKTINEKKKESAMIVCKSSK